MRDLMLKTQIIDVTLRDGGYRNNFNFSIDYVINHARNIYESGIDYLEVGYRNGSGIPIENMGITGFSSNEYLERIHREVPNMKLVVIAHAKNIDENDIHEMADCGVSMVRFCVNPKNMDETFKLAKIAKKRGMQVSLNIVRISSIDFDVLEVMVSRIYVYKDFVDIIYFADSNGNLNPSQVSEIVNLFRKNSALKIGFHAHDNMGLAMSNSITALSKGASFLDASLLGMGKGIGNLKLEQWVAYNLSIGYEKYSLEVILSAISNLRADPEYVPQDDIDYNIDMICGLLNVPFTEREKIFARMCARNAKAQEKIQAPELC